MSSLWKPTKQKFAIAIYVTTTNGSFVHAGATDAKDCHDAREKGYEWLVQKYGKSIKDWAVDAIAVDDPYNKERWN